MKLETNICDDINTEILNKMMANQAQQSTKNNNKLKKKNPTNLLRWLSELNTCPTSLMT